jgi:hypothetical protein
LWVFILNLIFDLVYLCVLILISDFDFGLWVYRSHRICSEQIEEACVAWFLGKLSFQLLHENHLFWPLFFYVSSPLYPILKFSSFAFVLMCKIGSFDFVLMWVVFDMLVGVFYIGFRILGL